jgi:HSP20 family protein
MLSRTFFRSPNSWSNSLLDEVFGHVAPTVLREPLARRPALDIWAEGDVLHIEAELPGLSIEDIDLELGVKGDVLRLAGERAETTSDDAERGTDETTAELAGDESGDAAGERDARQLYVRERHPIRFERELRLPFEVQAEAVSAEFVNGVLHVRLPKAEAVKPRRIRVTTSAE